jgi:AcrR family transcriptional regulator
MMKLLSRTTDRADYLEYDRSCYLVNSVSPDSTTTQTRRPREDGERSRRTILRAAANLATIDGLDGISIGNLAAHIGMSKSGLYAHFRSKEELQLATVETAREIFDAEVVEPTRAIVDPLARLGGLCDCYLSHLERRVFPGGCFFASTAAEFDMHPGAVKDKIASVQQHWIGRLERLIREAQASGSLDATEDPPQLAFELYAYLLMGNTTFVLYDSPAYLQRARAAITDRLSRAAVATL